jgi:hypothetical protein
MKLTCPPPRIEYRFIPRSLLEDQLDPNSLSDISKIFGQNDPWLGGAERGEGAEQKNSWDSGNNFEISS